LPFDQGSSIKHDGISVARYIIPAWSISVWHIVIHVVSGVAHKLSATLQKDCVGAARIVGGRKIFSVTQHD
jgi:hypothetical protein